MNLEDAIPPAPMEYEHQAGFMPPVVNIAHSAYYQAQFTPRAIGRGHDAAATTTTLDDESSGDSNMYSDDDSSSQPSNGCGTLASNIENFQSNDSQTMGFEDSYTTGGNSIKSKKSKRSSNGGRKPRNGEKVKIRQTWQSLSLQSEVVGHRR